MPLLHRPIPTNRFWLPLALAVLICAATPQPALAQEYGIKAKRPVIAGACKVCPWGALAEIVKAAMQPYGYDVQICSIPTTITLVSSLNPALASQDVTFVANVDPPQATGTITFLQGQTSLGTAPLKGGQASFATSSLAAGDLSITAVYSGDQQYAASTSRELKQTVQ